MNYSITSRRYLGNKNALTSWILGNIPDHAFHGTFFDVFAGTGAVSAAAAASGRFEKLVINDFLYSNEAIYKGYFGRGKIDMALAEQVVSQAEKLAKSENYFSINFGGKYFSEESARQIGAIRQTIDELIPNPESRTRYFVLASLVYSADRSANTVGHYEAFLRNNSQERVFEFQFITPISANAEIFRRDSNELVSEVAANVAYVDPPYNSRQYSRFYHVLETLVKWDQPELFGIAQKPAPENISEYSKVGAVDAMSDLVKNINAEVILISYNNTFEPKSSSSKNKISLEDLSEICAMKGKVRIEEIEHRHFNAGKTNFTGHRELLFVIESR